MHLTYTHALSLSLAPRSSLALSLSLSLSRARSSRFRATISRIRSAIKDRRMFMLDAFRLWDFDRSGGLSGPELYGGLEWLGVHLEQVQMKEIMTRIDYDSDGYISFSEFQATLTNGVELDDGEEEADIAALIAEDEAEARATGVPVKKTAFSSALQIQPKSMGEHAHFIDGRAVGPEITVVEEITAQQMALIRIKIKPITRFDEVSFHSSPPIIYFCSFAFHVFHRCSLAHSSFLLTVLHLRAALDI